MRCHFIRNAFRCGVLTQIKSCSINRVNLMAGIVSLQSCREVVNLVVGGNNFCFRKEDLKRFPDSYFAHFLKDEWRYDKSDDIYIDRDGWLFYYVFAYIVSDSLEFRPTAFTLEAMMAIRREADFFNLPGMIAKCDEKISEQLQEWCTNTATCANSFSGFTCEPEYSKEVTPLFRALNATVRQATAATGVSKLNFNLPSFENQSKLPSDIRNRFATEIRGQVQSECGTCLTYGAGGKKGKARHQKGIYLYPTGRYCKQRVPMFTADGVILRGITLLIPRTCVFTGGKITAVGCGQTMSINKPGDCMCLVAGMMYSVDTVTSGNLVIMETEFYVETRIHLTSSGTTVDPLALTHFSAYHTDQESHMSSLTAALTTELISYPSGVIICLTTLYPITHSPDPENNHIYTDPDSLQDKDAVLYTTLCEDFAVSVVTVFLCRTNPDSISPAATNSVTLSTSTATTATGTVISITAAVSTDTTINNNNNNTLAGCLVDSALPDIEGARYKIVPVVYGYGESFRVGDQNQQLGSLLTGLLVIAREKV